MSNDSNFIELNRRFRKLDPKAKPEDVTLESYSFDLFWGDKGFGWEDLLKRSRVVILGEPGSGKSWEFCERARILAEQGHFAFFIRLDQLIDQNIESILAADELKRFATWKRGERRGLFFLDSVDEAKFHSLRDFHSALDKFKTTLGSDALDRSDIFLSSRISEWQPENDAYEFNRRFPLPPRERRKGDGEKAVDSDDQLLVVQLCALSQGQVENLARGIGVTDVEAFISALDKNFAWEFARRPLDVRDLVGLE
jgi:hypothetical protein